MLSRAITKRSVADSPFMLCVCVRNKLDTLLLLLLLSHVSHVRSHRQQPTKLLSLGFSRQEYWSGLPFPSPVHESEK